jgi:hypothetical protein
MGCAKHISPPSRRFFNPASSTTFGYISGDRGGNSIPLRQGDNLHALWDALLGKQHRLNDVRREWAELKTIEDAWSEEIAAEISIAVWIKESHELAKSFAYPPVVLAAVRELGELQRVDLPQSYLKEAGLHAERRVVAAGMRLATVLEKIPSVKQARRRLASQQGSNVLPVYDVFERAAAQVPEVAPTPIVSSSEEGGSLSHWLNANGNVRHNSSCRWFKNTKKGRLCRSDEGKPCGQCGG